MPLNNEPIAFDRRRVSTALLAIAWFAALCWWHRFVVVDDPWITFRYAQNVLSGNGFVFNPGDALEGYSNFTWVVASIAAIGAHLEPLGAARMIGCAAAACLLAGLCFVSRVRAPGRLSGGESAALLLAGAYPFAVWTMGGLETSAYAALLCIYVYLLHELWNSDRPLLGALAGGIAALLAMTRVEGAMWITLAILPWLLPGNRPSKKSAAALFGTFGAIFLAYTVWRYFTFGTVVPNTVSAKVGGSLRTALGSGGAYAARYFLHASGAFVLLAILGLLVAWKEQARRQLSILLACGAALQFAFAIAVGGDWMPAARFFVPMLPLLCVLAGMALSHLRLPLQVTIVGAAIFGMAAQAKFDRELNWYRWAGSQTGELVVEPLVAAGREIGRRAVPGDTLAGTEAGVIPYYSGVRFIDMLGLVDRHIASLEGGLHEKFDAQYVLDLAPRFIAIQYGESGGSLQPAWPPDAAVVAHPGFAAAYREAWREPRLLPTAEYGMRDGALVLYEKTGEI